MDSRKHKRAALYQKLHTLRDATHSTAMNKTSIIIDASKYIEELKAKVETLDQEIGTSQSAATTSDNLKVTVETVKKGFRINVLSEENCPGLLVSILEAFEDMGLDVLDARVSCSQNFQLEAVGEDNDENVDAHGVKQAVLQAIKNWKEAKGDEDDHEPATTLSD